MGLFAEHEAMRSLTSLQGNRPERLGGTFIIENRPSAGVRVRVASSFSAK